MVLCFAWQVRGQSETYQYSAPRAVSKPCLLLQLEKSPLDVQVMSEVKPSLKGLAWLPDVYCRLCCFDGDPALAQRLSRDKLICRTTADIL